MSPRLSRTTVLEQLEPRRLLTTIAPGLPDTAFGTHQGVTFTDVHRRRPNILGDRDFTDDQLHKVLPMPDGRFIAVGESAWRDSIFSGRAPALVRYLANGSVDPTYGVDGIAGRDFTFNAGVEDGLLLPDGSVVLALVEGTLGAALARYTPQGELDDTFGEAGVARLPSGWNFEGGHRDVLERQADGKLLLLARALLSTGTFDRIVARFNTDGTLDQSFGLNGATTLNVANDVQGRTIIRRGDGKIVVLAKHFEPEGGAGIVQLNADGSHDTSFGDGDGVAALRLPSRGNVTFAAAPDGGYLIMPIWPYGFTATSLDLLKVRADGSPDPTFGDDGFVALEFDGVDFGESDLLIDSSGKILVAGRNAMQIGERNVVLARLNTDGSLDTSFASQGLFKAFPQATLGSSPTNLAFAADGAILVGGGAVPRGKGMFMLMRFHNTPATDEPVINIGAGTLTVRGTSGGDAIRIRTRADGRIEARVNDLVEGVPVSLVKAIHVTGGGGDDSFDASGLGALVHGAAMPVTIEGGDGNDVITGSTSGDRIRGEFGNDRMDGGGGDDLLSGNANHDRVHGGAGHDVLLGAGGIDVLVGDDGDDTVFAGEHDDVVFGSAGNDLLNGEGGNDKLFGDDGDDQVYGGAGHDTLTGGAGGDDLAGSAGNDVLLARDDFADTLSGGVGLLDRAQVDEDDIRTGIEQLLA